MASLRKLFKFVDHFEADKLNLARAGSWPKGVKNERNLVPANARASPNGVCLSSRCEPSWPCFGSEST